MTISEWLPPGRGGIWTHIETLALTGDWTSLLSFLSDPRRLVTSWKDHPDSVLALWTGLESESPHRAAETYGPWLDQLDNAPALLAAGHLLYVGGQSNAALPLLNRATELADVARDPATGIDARYQLTRIRSDRYESTDADTERAYRDLAEQAAASGLHRQGLWIAGDIAQQLQPAAALALLQNVEAEARARAVPNSVERCLSLRAHFGRLTDQPESMTLPLTREATEMCRGNGWWASLQWNVRVEGDIIYRRDPEGAMALYEEGERISRAIGYPRGITQALFDRAWLLNARGRRNDALAIHRERAALGRRLGQAGTEEQGLAYVATILDDKEQHAEAAQAAMTRVEVCRRIARVRNPEVLGYALCHLGEILIDANRPNEAEPHLREANEMGKELGVWGVERRALTGLALARAACGETAGTLAAYRDLCDRAAGDDTKIADALNGLAAPLIDRNHEAVALPILRTADRLARRTETSATAAYTAANLGLIHKKLGRKDAALGYFRRNEEHARKGTNPREITLALMRQADVLQAMARHHEAAELLREATVHVRGLFDPTTLINCLDHLASALRESGRRDEATATAREASEIAARAGRKDESARLRDLIAEIQRTA